MAFFIFAGRTSRPVPKGQEWCPVWLGSRVLQEQLPIEWEQSRYMGFQALFPVWTPLVSRPLRAHLSLSWGFRQKRSFLVTLTGALLPLPHSAQRAGEMGGCLFLFLRSGRAK